MKEVYILSDGTSVDISGYSQFEKTKFLLDNPNAKKSKNTANGASTVLKKKKAPSTDSSSEKSSSVSKSKFRLANDEDLEAYKKTQKTKPTYGFTQKQSNVYEDYYNLKQQNAEQVTEAKKKEDDYKYISQLDKADEKKEMSPVFSNDKNIDANNLRLQTEEEFQKEQFKTQNPRYYHFNKLTKDKLELDNNLKKAISEGYVTEEDINKLGVYNEGEVSSKLYTQKEVTEAEKKVNFFRSKLPYEVEASLDLDKMDKEFKYIDDYDEGDDFVSSMFNVQDLANIGVNDKDFNGFLLAKGYKDDINRFKELELDESTYGNNYNPKLAWEKRKVQYLNLYLNDQIQRDIKKQKFDFIKNKSQEEGKIFDFSLADYHGFKYKPNKNLIDKIKNYGEFLKKEAPELVAAMEEVDRKNSQNYTALVESKGNVGAGKFTLDLLKNGWDGFTRTVNSFGASLYDVIIPGDFGEGVAESMRLGQEIYDFKEGENFRYVTARGYKTTVEGVDYIYNNSNGRIYDITNKLDVTNILTEKQKEDISNKAFKEGNRDTSFSYTGTAYQGATVIGDLVFQLALTRSFGNTLSAAGGFTEGAGVLGKTKSYLKSVPIARSMSESVIAQSTLGFTRGYEDTLKAAREAGIEDNKAKELASIASIETGIWYALTAPINPQTKATDLLFGKARNEVIEQVINAYVNTGKKGFIETLRGFGKNLLDISGEGLAEVIQENVQQVGETYVINKDVNRLAGQQILQDSMSLQDFMDTTILSFVAGAVIPGAGVAATQIKKSTREMLGMQGVDRFNALGALAYNKKKVSDFLSKQVIEGLYTQQQVDDLLSEIDAYSSSINTMPQNISAEAAEDILDDVVTLSKLEQQKKQTDKSFHAPIDEQIDEVRSRIERRYYDDITAKRTSTIKKAIQEGKVSNLEYREFENEQDIIDTLVSEFNYDESEAEQMASNPGFILTEENLEDKLSDEKFFKGKKFIFINNAMAAEMSQFSVGKHEFLHGLIYETIKGDRESQILLGRALAGEILGMHQEIMQGMRGGNAAPEGFLKRFSEYVNKYSELINNQKILLQRGSINEEQYKNNVDTFLGNQWEEVLTLYSDAIDNGSVVFDDDIFTRIGDVIRRVLQRLGVKNIEFNSGRDVYNFIKDYNRSIEKGNFGGSIAKLSTSKAKVNKESLRAQVDKNKKPSAAKPKPVVNPDIRDNEFTTDAKFSLKSDRIDPEKFKREVNAFYNKNKWADSNYLDSILYEILDKYDITIKQKAKGYGYSYLPDYSEEDMVAETQVGLINVIRNFNKEFFELREEYKKELVASGLKEGTPAFNEKLEEKDLKGYKGKKGVVKENNDLNAYINSLLKFKMMDALKTGSVTSKQYNDDIDSEFFKQSSIEGFDYEESEDMLDDIDSLLDEKQEYELEQSKLAILLKDPIFGFTDEDGNPIDIETIPFGIDYVQNVDDPVIPANKKLKKATDPDEIKALEAQLKKLKRGLELESKGQLTPEEKEELKILKSFKSFSMSKLVMENTYEAFSTIGRPSKIISEEIAAEIRKSPNIQTLEYRNFKEKVAVLATTLSRRMTFKNSIELERFMYNNWETIYNVINNPTDPVTGESTYTAKKLPPRLKQLDADGNFIKRKDINRATFLQSYFRDEDVRRIIEKHSKNSRSELSQLEEVELNENTGKGLSQNAHFDRRTALIEMFGDVLVLQEARRLLRDDVFLESIKERNVNLYNDLKDDIKREAILNNMAKGKSDIVKYSLRFIPENEVDRTTKKRVVSEKAIKESIISVSNNPINKLLNPSSIEDVVKYSLKDLTSKKLEGYNKKFENHYKEVERAGKFTSKESRDKWFEREKKDYVKALMLSDLKDQTPGTKLHTLNSFEEIQKEVERRVVSMIVSMEASNNASQERIDLGLAAVPIYLYTGADINMEGLSESEIDIKKEEIRRIRAEQEFMLGEAVNLIESDSSYNNQRYKYNIFYTYLYLEDILSNRYDLDYKNKQIQRKKFKQSDYSRTRLPINVPNKELFKESLDIFYDSDTLYPLAGYNLYKIEIEDETIEKWNKERLFLPSLSGGHKAFKFDQSNNEDDHFSLHMFASRNNESQWCTGQAIFYADQQLSEGDFYIITDKDYKPVIAVRMETNEETGNIKIGEIVGIHKSKVNTQESQIINKEEIPLLAEFYNELVSKEKDSKKETADISLVLNNVDNIMKYEETRDVSFVNDKAAFAKQASEFTRATIKIYNKINFNKELNKVRSAVTNVKGISEISEFKDYGDELELVVGINDDITIVDDQFQGDVIEHLRSITDIGESVIEAGSESSEDADNFSLRIENNTDYIAALSLDNIVDVSQLMDLTFNGFLSHRFENLKKAGVVFFDGFPDNGTYFLTTKRNAEFEMVDFALQVMEEDSFIYLSRETISAQIANIIIKEGSAEEVYVKAQNIQTNKAYLSGSFYGFLNGTVREIELERSKWIGLDLKGNLDKLTISLQPNEDGDVDFDFDKTFISFTEGKKGKNLILKADSKSIENKKLLTDLVNSDLIKNFDNVYLASFNYNSTNYEITIKQDGKLNSATGDIKFSLAEQNNAKSSEYLENLKLEDQLFVSRIIDNAVTKARNISKNPITFKVPSLKGMNDKARSFFLIDKVADGYNDFEFLNKEDSKGKLTQSVLNVSDIKFSLASGNANYNSDLEVAMNEIIQENRNVDVNKKYSPETAKNIGKNIGRYEVWVPPSDDDFLGLIYRLAEGKGEKGEKQLEFFDEALIKPYSDAMLNLMHERQQMYRDWTNLINKKYKGISKRLKQDSGYGGYTIDQAIRVWLWDRAGYEVPGLDAKDLFHLKQIVRKDKELRDFATDVAYISKQPNGYTEPDHNWGFGSIVSDIHNEVQKANRKKYLEHWQHNVDKIFSKDNLSKIEAIYGRQYVKALNNILGRMKSGSNRAEGGSDTFINWLNGATGVTMFFNMRSGVLQTISMLNFLNTGDNNPIKVGARMLDVKQFNEDFFTLWNSDYLKDRRSNLMSDIAEAELAQAMNDPRNKSVLDKFKAANAWILKQGFAPTRIADSFAIAFGGASFYRNRINTYINQGDTKEDARKKAMRDLYETSEMSQQSADVSKISMNQASTKGRLIFAFQNTPLQYSRLITRAAIDIVKGRGDFKTNVAKIIYYSVIQNALFNILQNALFSMMFDDEDEQKAQNMSGSMRAINGGMDSLLRGSGLTGAAISVIKNMAIKWYEVHGDPKGGGEILVEAANISPPIGIKARKLMKTYKTVEYNFDEIRYKGFSIDNRYALEATATITTAVLNAPVDRVYQKVENLHDATVGDFEIWQRIALALGYSKWNLGEGQKGKGLEPTGNGTIRQPELVQDGLNQPDLQQ
jgi:hypothetical protein